MALLAVFLAHPAVDPLAPATKTAGLELFAHQLDDFLFRQAELVLDGFEGRAVLPGHFNNSIQVSVGQIRFHSICGTADPALGSAGRPDLVPAFLVLTLSHICWIFVAMRKFCRDTQMLAVI